MLLRYPGLSLVSVLGMSVGITIAAGAFTIVSLMMDTKLPLPGGRAPGLAPELGRLDEQSRVAPALRPRGVARREVHRGLQRVAQRPAQPDRRRPAARGRDGGGDLGVGFPRGPRRRLRGRTLLPEDERAGAPDAIVIGHDEWVRRFGADPDIVGQSVGLGPTAYTIVGVMPEGFGFPTLPQLLDPVASRCRRLCAAQRSQHQRVWTARAWRHARERAGGAHGDRPASAAASPATHEHLRPLVIPYAHAFSDMDEPQNALALYAIEIAIVLLLILVCINVAILVYARTATRQGEIAVRGALGASRRRIVAQLFVEALMLAGVSAAIGIGLTSVALRQIEGAMLAMVGRWPFWFSLELQTGTVIYVVGLTLLRRPSSAWRRRSRRPAARSTRGCKRFRLAADRACRWGGCGRR